MKFSESIKEISGALLNVQRDIEQPKKSAINPFHKSRYVPLDGVVEALKPVLVANGLSYTQSLVSSEEGVGVQTMILHSSGEWILHEPFYLPLQQKTPQGGAGASTYARRYSLSAAFGIVPEDDDDANTASGLQTQTKNKKEIDF